MAQLKNSDYHSFMVYLAPGGQMVVMFGGWMIPLFLRDAWFESLSDVKSFAEYYFAWGVIGATAAGLTPFLQWQGRWPRLRYWGKCAIVCGVYTLLSGVITLQCNYVRGFR